MTYANAQDTGLTIKLVTSEVSIQELFLQDQPLPNKALAIKTPRVLGNAAASRPAQRGRRQVTGLSWALTTGSWAVA